MTRLHVGYRELLIELKSGEIMRDDTANSSRYQNLIVLLADSALSDYPVPLPSQSYAPLLLVLVRLRRLD